MGERHVRAAVSRLACEFVRGISLNFFPSARGKRMAAAHEVPVIAGDVGTLKEDVVAGATGFICRPESPSDPAETIERRLDSDRYRDLPEHRAKIAQYARDPYSWEKIGLGTCSLNQTFR